jgi:hypothetical protein
MGRIGVCVAPGLALAGIVRTDDPEVARLGPDIRLLHHLKAAMREKPDDRTLRTDAADLARRIAPHTRGNRLVWQVLLETKVLEDGMMVEQAEKPLGPATEGTPERAGWYDNPDNRRHVAPYPAARITQNGLAGWKLINR